MPAHQSSTVITWDEWESIAHAQAMADEALDTARQVVNGYRIGIACLYDLCDAVGDLQAQRARVRDLEGDLYRQQKRTKKAKKDADFW